MEHADAADAHGGQLPDDPVHLVVVRAADVECVTVRRVAQRLGAGEGGKQADLVRHCDRQGGQRGRGAHVAEQGQHAAIDQHAGVARAALRFVAVVQAQQFDGPAGDAAGRVHAVEHQHGASSELGAQRSTRARERGRLAQKDGIAAVRTNTGPEHGAGEARAGSNEVAAVHGSLRSRTSRVLPRRDRTRRRCEEARAETKPATWSVPARPYGCRSPDAAGPAAWRKAGADDA